MKKNMGGFDKAIRLIVAAIIVILYLTGVVGGILGIVLLVVAGVFVLVSLIGVCPIYPLIGLNTMKKKK